MSSQAESAQPQPHGVVPPTWPKPQVAAGDLPPPVLAGRALTDWYHVCALFDSREQEYQLLAPFFRDAIDLGEKVVHIVDPALLTDHLGRLEAQGIDTIACRHCGQLEVLSWDDVYLSGARFDQDRMINAIEGVVAAGRLAGYPRTRIMGSMGWTLKGRPGTEQVLEFESRVNDVLERERQVAVCVYDLASLSGSATMDILRSHPLTLVGNIVHENPFYTPATQLLLELRARAKGPDSPPVSPATTKAIGV